MKTFKFKGWLWLQATTALKPIASYDAKVWPKPPSVLCLATLIHTMDRLQRSKNEASKPAVPV